MQEPVTHTQKLYVVLHGLIPLVEDGAGIHAIMVEMDGHSMLVGHWLAEKPLQKFEGATLRLTGVGNGCAGIDPRLNLVVNMAEIDLDKIAGNPSCYARIDLPKPEKLRSFFTADAKDRLTGKHQPVLQKYSAVQVFEYTVPGESFDDVSITCGNMAVWTNCGYTLFPDRSKVSVVHIYNEPAGYSSDDHSTDEFLKGSALFGVDVGLDRMAPLPFPSEIQPSQADLPSGLLIQELAPLARRGLAVSNILDSLRSGTPVPEGLPIADNLFCGAIFIIIGIELWRRWFEHHP